MVPVGRVAGAPKVHEKGSGTLNLTR